MRPFVQDIAGRWVTCNFLEGEHLPYYSSYLLQYHSVLDGVLYWLTFEWSRPIVVGLSDVDVITEHGNTIRVDKNLVPKREFML